MANRYWVGGTASWDGTAGTKWALTSGGTGGEAVPTSADDVFFDGNSGANTVTIAAGNTGAKSINCTGFTGTLAGTTAISVAGNVTLVAGMTCTYTGTLTLTATATLITAGKTIGGVTIDATSGTVTLGDALNTGTGVNRVLTLTNGTLDTAGYTVTTRGVNANNSNTRTLTLGASNFTISTGGFDVRTATGITVNAGTSTLNFIETPNFGFRVASSLTFYDVIYADGVSVAGLSGGTLNNLTLTNTNDNRVNLIELSSNLTINGTFTITASAIKRVSVASSVIGTTRTITAATLSGSDCDFSDITIAGGASGTSLTRAGDCGGNSGITFPASKTVYRVGTNTTWGGSSSWATSTGGTGADNNFPLPQDIAIINDDTTLTGTLSLPSSSP